MPGEAPLVAVKSKPSSRKKLDYFNDILLTSATQDNIKKAIYALEHGADVNVKGTVRLT